MEQAPCPEVSLPSPFVLLQETVICFKVRFASLIENDCAKPIRTVHATESLKKKKF